MGARVCDAPLPALPYIEDVPKMIGYRHLARLAVAVERHVTAQRANPTTPTPTDPAATRATVS